jgi:hypothetical protein
MNKIKFRNKKLGEKSISLFEIFVLTISIVAFAYFDFDLYEPTKGCLLTIKDRLTRGSILGFDELNDEPDAFVGFLGCLFEQPVEPVAFAEELLERKHTGAVLPKAARMSTK